MIKKYSKFAGFIYVGLMLIVVIMDISTNEYLPLNYFLTTIGFTFLSLFLAFLLAIGFFINQKQIIYVVFLVSSIVGFARSLFTLGYVIQNYLNYFNFFTIVSYMIPYLLSILSIVGLILIQKSLGRIFIIIAKTFNILLALGGISNYLFTNYISRELRLTQITNNIVSIYLSLLYFLFIYLYFMKAEKPKPVVPNDEFTFE